jgi:hypothetical protein
MFVHWRRRERTRTKKRSGQWRTGEWVKYAVLAESVRTTAGPRHKYVCYLGSIREAQIDAYWHRSRFWESVAKNLDAAGIVGEQRQTIETALLAVVGKPDRNTEYELRTSRELREIMQRLRKADVPHDGDQAGDL